MYDIIGATYRSMAGFSDPTSASACKQILQSIISAARRPQNFNPKYLLPATSSDVDLLSVNL